MFFDFITRPKTLTLHLFCRNLKSIKSFTKGVLKMFRLDGKVALITGASGGLGDKIARTLYAQGAKLALTDVHAEGMEKLKAELGDGVETFTANLSDAEAIKNLVSEVEAKFGQIDILVNNAGLTRDNLFMRMSDEEWQLVLDVNLSAGFKLARGVIRGMMKRRSGRIIGIASVVGVMAFPNLEPVHCSISGSNFCFLTCIQISQEAIKVDFPYSSVGKNLPAVKETLVQFLAWEEPLKKG